MKQDIRREKERKKEDTGAPRGGGTIESDRRTTAARDLGHEQETYRCVLRQIVNIGQLKVLGLYQVV